MTSPAAHTVQCTKDNCTLPVAEIVNGELVIMARHHGEKHYARLSVVDLVALIAANTDTNLLTPRETSSILAAEGRTVISS